MSENSGIKRLDKVFAHCTIQWKVLNLCLTFREAFHSIYSPEFLIEGDCSTGWRMAIFMGQKTEPENDVSLILERLPDSGPDVVLVYSEATVTIGSKTFHSGEKFFSFEKDAIKSMYLTNLEMFSGELKRFTAVALIIQCNMIIRPSKELLNLNQTPFRFKKLSRDLKDMLKEDKYKDFTIEAQGKRIKVHKCMLCGSDILKSMTHLHDQHVENPERSCCSSKENVLKLSGRLTYEDVCKYIDFIYSGDMDTILSEPTFSMYALLHLFGSDALLRYYAPERLEMITDIKTDEFSFSWLIDNLDEIYEHILPSLSHGNCSIRTWRLRFLPRFDSFSVVAEILEGALPIFCFCEFATVDANQNLKHAQHIAQYENENSLFEYSVRKSEIDLLHQSSNTITIFFKVRSFVELESYVLSMTYPPTSNKTSYEELSSKMGKLLQTEFMYDIIVWTEGEECRAHKAHKSVLSARSVKLREMIDALDDSCILIMKNIEPLIFRMFITFIYRAVLVDCEFVNLIELCDLAVEYTVKGMLLECVECMHRKVTEENRSLVLKMVRSIRNKCVADLVYKSLSTNNIDRKLRLEY